MSLARPRPRVLLIHGSAADHTDVVDPVGVVVVARAVHLDRVRPQLRRDGRGCRRRRCRAHCRRAGARARRRLELRRGGRARARVRAAPRRRGRRADRAAAAAGRRRASAARDPRRPRRARGRRRSDRGRGAVHAHRARRRRSSACRARIAIARRRCGRRSAPIPSRCSPIAPATRRSPPSRCRRCSSGGARSAAYFRATLDALARVRRRNARLEIVANAGHMLHAEAFRRFDELLVEFAASVGMADASST